MFGLDSLYLANSPTMSIKDVSSHLLRYQSSVASSRKSKMRALLILVSVAVAIMGQGPEGGEGPPIPAAAPDCERRGDCDPCKCQCVFPAVTYNCKFTPSGKCGNCERYRGHDLKKIVTIHNSFKIWVFFLKIYDELQYLW